MKSTILEPRLLAIFAHPDDESFCCGGSLALLASQGVDVHVLCLTKGEAGAVPAAILGKKSVPQLRQLELQQACQILGVQAPRFLGYHDSGFRQPSGLPNRLVDADVFAVAREVRTVIDQTKPDALLTFDPRGYYGHPDHIATHQIVNAAFFSSASLAKPPQKLFYIMPSRAMLVRFNQAGFGQFDLDEYALPDPILTLDTSAVLEQKRAAILAHRSQSHLGSGIDKLLPELHSHTSSQVLTEEIFALGGTRATITAFPLETMF
jgi:N-acetyl-1-D-myo-inositol-2-amino-2-deoxy-alpha-D-glucopyranoside deacetylase